MKVQTLGVINNLSIRQNGEPRKPNNYTDINPTSEKSGNGKIPDSGSNLVEKYHPDDTLEIRQKKITSESCGITTENHVSREDTEEFQYERQTAYSSSSLKYSFKGGAYRMQKRHR